MLLSEFGQLLSEARLKKELSIDDVALRLKISARVVRALEDGNLDSLLHGTYVCAFTRTYANFLSLDPDLINEMIEAIDIKNIVQSIPLSPGYNHMPSSNIKYYIALLIVLIMTIGGIWYLINSNIFPLNFKSADLLTIIQPNTTKQDNIIKTENKASATLDDDAQIAVNLKIDAEAKSLLDNMEKDAEKASDLNIDENQEKTVGENLTLDNDNNTNDNNAVIEQNKSDIQEKDMADQKIAEAKALAVKEKAMADQKIEDAKALAVKEKAMANQKTEDAKALAAKENTQVIPQIINDKKVSLNTDTNVDTSNKTDDNGDMQAHRMIITALEVCWISSNADNTNIRQFILQKGSTYALTFSKTLILKLGNAGGVRIRYNGKDISPVGKVGEVKTIRFP